MAVQHAGLASYRSQNTEVYILHQLVYKARHCVVSLLPQTEVQRENICFYSASLHHVLLRRESSFVPVTLLSKF